MRQTCEHPGQERIAHRSIDALYGRAKPGAATHAAGDRRERTLPIVQLAPLAVTAAILGLIGCGSSTHTVDIAHVEHSIAVSIFTQHHISVAVSCPNEVPIEVGRGFTCRAKLEVGTYPVRAIEINNSGRVRYANQDPLVVLNVSAVKQAIARSLLNQRRTLSVVSCPMQILQKEGIFFRCSATAGTEHRVFDVTQVDSTGHVRYVEAH